MQRGWQPCDCDEELIARAKQGDDEAIAELWHRDRASAVGVARAQRCASPEDVVDEAFTRVLQALRRGEGPDGYFAGYLHTAVRNIAQDQRKSKAAETLSIDTADVAAVSHTQVEDQALGHIEGERIEKVFAQMPPREARLVRAVLADGMSVAEAAKLEGVTPNHASVILRRGRVSFQRLWFQSHVGDAPRAGDCGWAMQHAGAHLAGTLGKADARRMDDHLANCDECAAAAKEAKESSHIWGKALLGTSLGMLPAGLATTAWAGPAIAGLGTLVVGTLVLAVTFSPVAAAPEVPVASHPPAISIAPPPTSAAPSVSPTPTETPSVTPSATPPPATHPPSVRPSPPVMAAIVASATTRPQDVCYPVLSGTAQPGAKLTVSGWGWTLGVRADGAGRWSTPPVTAARAGTIQYSVTYATGDGSATGAVHLAGPPSLSVTPRPDGVLVVLTGTPGVAAQVLVDGVVVATWTLDAGGQAQGVLDVVPGTHQIQTRHAPGCLGPLNVLAVDV